MKEFIIEIKKTSHADGFGMLVKRKEDKLFINQLHKTVYGKKAPEKVNLYALHEQIRRCDITVIEQREKRTRRRFLKSILPTVTDQERQEIIEELKTL